MRRTFSRRPRPAHSGPAAGRMQARASFSEILIISVNSRMADAAVLLHRVNGLLFSSSSVTRRFVVPPSITRNIGFPFLGLCPKPRQEPGTSFTVSRTAGVHSVPAPSSFASRRDNQQAFKIPCLGAHTRPGVFKPALGLRMLFVPRRNRVGELLRARLNRGKIAAFHSGSQHEADRPRRSRRRARIEELLHIFRASRRQRRTYRYNPAARARL